MDNIDLQTAFSLYNSHCKSCGRKESSLKLNTYAQGHLEDFTHLHLKTRNPALDQLDRFLIRNFLTWLREERGLSDSTVQRNYDVLSALFGFLVREELIVVNPMDKVAKPRRSPHIINPLSVEQVQTLINAFDVTTFSGLRNRLVVALLFDTGVRATELCMLDIEDVDLKQRKILLRHTKTGVPRYTYFSKVVANLLAGYLSMRESMCCKRLIVTRKGKPVDRHWLRRMIERAGDKVGIHLHPHLLRHSCAVASIINGADVSMIMRLLGHTNPRMSLHYSQLADTHVQKIHSRTSPADKLVVGE